MGTRPVIPWPPLEPPLLIPILCTPWRGSEVKIAKAGQNYTFLLLIKICHYCTLYTNNVLFAYLTPVLGRVEHLRGQWLSWL